MIDPEPIDGHGFFFSRDSRRLAFGVTEGLVGKRSLWIDGRIVASARRVSVLGCDDRNRFWVYILPAPHECAKCAVFGRGGTTRSFDCGWLWVNRDGKHVAWLAWADHRSGGGNIQMMLDGKPVGKRYAAIKCRGPRQQVFGPAGGHLAYVAWRGLHPHVAVFDGREIGHANDFRTIVWSDDGERAIFVGRQRVPKAEAGEAARPGRC